MLNLLSSEHIGDVIVLLRYDVVPPAAFANVAFERSRFVHLPLCEDILTIVEAFKVPLFTMPPIEPATFPGFAEEVFFTYVDMSRSIRASSLISTGSWGPIF